MMLPLLLRCGNIVCCHILQAIISIVIIIEHLFYLIFAQERPTTDVDLREAHEGPHKEGGWG